MHAVVMQSLEEYFAGTLEPAAQREIQAHLKTCEMCRDETQSMQEISRWFGSLQPREEMSPTASFYTGVLERIAEQQLAPSVARLLGLDFAFGRRLVFASLLTLAVLGSYLISRETAYPSGPSPEAVMAQQELPAFDSAPAPDNMLVSLTAYEH
jgi:anti-sigma factor RsiW